MFDRNQSILKNAYVNDQLAIKQDLQKVEQDWAAAVVANDADKIGAFLTDLYLYVNPKGISQDKSDHLNDFKSGKLKLTGVTIIPNPPFQSRAYDGSAVVSFVANVTGSFAGADIGGTYRFTDTFVRHGYQWRAAAREQVKIP